MTPSSDDNPRTRMDPDASDEDLVLATRAGDNRAYGQLWDRHSPAALRAARAITGSIDPEDLVSEAFAKTLSAISNGGGPTGAFRPYIFAAVRSAAATWGGRQKDVALEYIDELPADDGDSLDLLSDKALLTAAFKDLPERWRTLLWYLEVEGMKPREIGPLMGLSPNAVSVLAARAREGFKVAWLHAHIREPGRDAECRWTCERIVALGRKRRVPRADRPRFDAHLAQCGRCRIASAEVAQASSKLRVVLLPVLLGGSAAAVYSAASPAPALAAAVTVGAVTRSGTRWVLGGTGVTAVTVAATIVVAAGFVPAEPPVADAGASSRLVVESPTSISAPAVEPSPVVTPQPVLPSPPAVVPDVEPPTERVDTTVVPGIPPIAVVPAPPIDLLTQPGEKPDVPVDEPPGPAAEQGDKPVTIAWDVQGSSAIPPAVTGTGAAGARIDILDESEHVIASTMVDTEGAFAVHADADALHQGMSISARQVSPTTGEHTMSGSIGPVVFDMPAVSDASSWFVRRADVDADGAVDDVRLMLRGVAGQTVSISVEDGPVTSTLLTGAATSASLLDVRLGLRRVTVRYVDPVTGALGPRGVERIVVVP